MVTPSGEVAEWLKAPDSKSGLPERVAGVRIPSSPPSLSFFQVHQKGFEFPLGGRESLPAAQNVASLEDNRDAQRGVCGDTPSQVAIRQCIGGGRESLPAAQNVASLEDNRDAQRGVCGDTPSQVAIRQCIGVPSRRKECRVSRK
jgi:hypothetical protein